MMASSILLATKKKKKSSLKELKTLGEQLLSSRAHINNLPRLLTFISPSSPPQHLLESILTLQSFFTPLLPDLPSSSSSSSSSTTKSSSLVVLDAGGGGDGDSSKNPEFVYKMWLRSKFDEFLKSLISIAVSAQSDEALRDVALDSIMEFVKLGKGGRFQSVIYHRLLLAIVHSSSSTVDFLLELLASKFFKYIDVRYFTYITLEKLARSLESTEIKDGINMSVHDSDEHISMSSDVELAVHRIHYLLSHIPPLEIQEGKSDYEMWSALGFLSNEDDGKGSMKGKHEGKQGKSKNSDNAVLSTSRIAKKMKLKFTKTWLSFLRLPLPLDLYKEVLVALHEAVIPYFSNPIMLCDFLTRSYDIGGVISVMALSSLFILMTQHGLEYPNFYEKLYVLLVPSIFLAKHRAKFFQLLDSCLKSPLLPAYLAAAFAKKLSRMALVVPPSGSLVIIALIHNLLRRHPSINCLVNQQLEDKTDGDVSGGQGDFVESAKESGSGLNASGEKPGIDSSSEKPGIDLFKNEESDPLKSNAMRSSVWEIDTLRNHYCPAVSRFVLSLENDLTVRAKTTEITVKDFSSGSYATIFREEIGRRIKQVPLAFYTNNAIPTSLFSESDFAGWTFKSEETKTAESGNAENGVSTISEEENQKSAKKQRIKSS